MEILDNINRLLGDDLKQVIQPGSKLRIAASCFSIYAFEALKAELTAIDCLQFIFTSPTFIPGEATDRLKKEHREFHIPKRERERSLYGSEFEVRLRNELTQRAIAKECADWMRQKAIFRSNRGLAPMQQFATVTAAGKDSVYLPLHGFTAVDLGYEKGNAVSNFVNRMDEQPATGSYLSLFDQIWNDAAKLEDVTAKLCEHIASVYQENSPERIYFLMLYNIFSEFLEDITADVLPNAVKQDQLALHTDNIKPDRTPEDLLFQVLLDWGVDLALPIEQQQIAGKTVFFVDGNALAACFDTHITEDLEKELAKRKPLRAVFRDSSFDSDSTKINVAQIFKLLSPETELKSL